MCADGEFGLYLMWSLSTLQCVSHSTSEQFANIKRKSIVMKRWIVGSVLGWMICGSVSAAAAADFKAFSTVEDVCPTCAKRAVDTITLDNGTKVKARIEAENEDYLVLSRYGEVRIIPKSRLMSVEWANNSERSGLTSQDQLVLSSGHVLTGSIIEENQEQGVYRLQSSLNQQIYVVFATQVESIYKAGSRI